ncbi:hypothetical protein VTI28DRAFT_9669 [Corynascus sepedonium]
MRSLCRQLSTRSLIRVRRERRDESGQRAAIGRAIGSLQVEIGACFRIPPSLLHAAPVHQLGLPPGKSLGRAPPRAYFPNLHGPFNMNLARRTRRSHMFMDEAILRTCSPIYLAPIHPIGDHPFCLPRRAVPSTHSRACGVQARVVGVCHSKPGADIYSSPPPAGLAIVGIRLLVFLG